MSQGALWQLNPSPLVAVAGDEASEKQALQVAVQRLTPVRRDVLAR